jgi:hypothetical protein
MERNKVFEKAESIINKIIPTLEFQLKALHQRGYGEQKATDYQQGLVKVNGIYVKLDSIEYKILFDAFEYSLLDIFILLYKKMFVNWEENLAQFSLRTLGEIGFQRLQILFSDEVSREKKLKYKLLIWLADYASMSGNRNSYRNNYQKLLDEYKYLLTKNEFDFYTNLITSIKGEKPIEEYKHIKKARRNINNLQSQLCDLIKPLPYIREINIVALLSSFSHILHGNVPLLKDILNTTRPNSQKLRIYWGLILSGINVTNRAGKYLKDFGEIERINQEFVELQVIITKYWPSIEAK